MRRLHWVVGTIVFFFTGFLAAQSATKSSEHAFEYPELLVTPLASDRVTEEANIEKSQKFTNHLPVQISALTTALAGVMAANAAGDIDKETKRDSAKYSALGAELVGFGWLGFTAVMSFTSSPYSSANTALKKMPAKSKREQLARERQAEEELEHTASTYNKIKWLSIASNFVVAGAVAGTSEDQMVKTTAGFAGLAAFAPLLFPYRAETIWDQHQDYKKRIYGPLVDVDVGFAKRGPVLMASIRF